MALVLLLSAIAAQSSLGIFGLNKLRVDVNEQLNRYNDTLSGLPYGEQIDRELAAGLSEQLQKYAEPMSRVLFASLFFACGLSLLWYVLMRNCVRRLVPLVIGLSLAGSLLFAVLNLAFGNFPVAIVVLVLMLVKCLVYALCWRRLQRAAEIVQLAFEAAQAALGVMRLYCMLWTATLAQALWLVLSAGAFYGVKKGSGADVFVVLATFWVTEWLALSVAFVVAYAVTEYAQMRALRVSPGALMARGATLAFTRSAGTIAFAALLSALLKVLLYLLKRWKKSRNPLVKICGFLCFACCTKLLQFFNSYLLVRAALDGTGYVTSMRSTADMFRRGGDNRSGLTRFDAIVSNFVIEDVVGGGTFVGAFVTASLATILVFTAYDLPFLIATIVIVAAFVVGYLTMYVPYCAVDSAVSSVFTMLKLERAPRFHTEKNTLTSFVEEEAEGDDE